VNAGAIRSYNRPVPGTDSSDPERLNKLRGECTRWLNGHGPQTPAELLATIPADVEADRYGAGGVVEALQREVASLLGKEAALFLPTGTMAQQIALRIHADRRGRRTVVWHPTCHLDEREGRGYQRLHGLVGVPAGGIRVPLRLEDLESIAEPPAALLLELPQRELGGTLPSWEELEALVGWARERGAAVHLDGARLWEAAPFYGRPESEIAGLFDTVYVSFYKGLGAIAGCCLAGPSDVVAEEAEWRIRHGGQVFGLWPYAASALTSLRMRRDRMAGYWEHAKAIAQALEGSQVVQVLPDPPQSRMMHLELRVSPDDLRERALSIAETEGIWSFAEPFAVDGPRLVRLELSVGDATLTFGPDEVVRLVERLAGA
jgi:threonine aldolase